MRSAAGTEGRGPRQPPRSRRLAQPCQYYVNSVKSLKRTRRRPGYAPGEPPPLPGVEARLIEAEAQLAASDPAWLTTLNGLRSTVPGLAPLVDPGTPQSRLQLLFQERGVWLFGHALRLSDMRRLIRQYGFSQDQVLPTGSYLKGGNYGTDVTIPIPFGERNNPSVTVGSTGVCLDRNP